MINTKAIGFIILLLLQESPLRSEHAIEEIYQKVNLESGTLDENGDELDFIFVPAKLKTGKYEIEVADGPGDLYEIKGTDYYIKFRLYYGYAGYGQEGLLIIDTYSYNNKFIKYQ